MTKLTSIEGIGPSYAEALEGAGVNSIETLLEAAATPKSRADLAAKSGLTGTLILKWANRADLARVKGIGEEYADLLEAAGVDTVPDLARRNPANLAAKLATVNEEKQLVRKVPSEKQVQNWVASAKALPRALEY